MMIDIDMDIDDRGIDRCIHTDTEKSVIASGKGGGVGEGGQREEKWGWKETFLVGNGHTI